MNELSDGFSADGWQASGHLPPSEHPRSIADVMKFRPEDRKDLKTENPQLAGSLETTDV
jgi:hypothetical protein